MSKILVTSYLNPDLDGVASALAYTELLKNNGQDAEAVLFGKPQPEVDFFSQKYGYHFPIKSGDQKSRWESYVIVDTSITKRLPKFIDPAKVVEILDHHPAETGEEFPNARVQNEAVGAVATLVYERFHKNRVKLDINMARLIYSAIFDNTIFLLANVTPRDLAAVDGLEKSFGFTRQIIDELIEFDKAYKISHFEEVLLNDLKEIETGDGPCVGGQMIFFGSMSDAGTKLKVESIAQRLYQERKIKVFMSLVDIDRKSTGIYTQDKYLQDKLLKVFGGDFDHDWTVIKSLVLRKKILNAIK